MCIVKGIKMNWGDVRLDKGKSSNKLASTGDKRIEIQEPKH